MGRASSSYQLPAAIWQFPASSCQFPVARQFDYYI